MFRIFDLLKSRARLSKVLAPVQGRLFPAVQRLDLRSLERHGYFFVSDQP